MLDELAAGALLERLGIARAPAVALDAGIARTPPLPFPYPVAVKLLSAEIAHKSDIGGVVLGVADGAALLAAIASNPRQCGRTNARAPASHACWCSRWSQASAKCCWAIGSTATSGPLVMVAAGGVLTEIERDRSLRLAPVDLAAAHEMIAEVRGLIALTGYRGKPKGDLEALADAIVALSRLADDASVAEAEINPLIVRPAGEGVVAVDAVW